MKIVGLMMMVIVGCARAEEKVAGVYCSIIEFASKNVRQRVVDANILSEKQESNVLGHDDQADIAMAGNCKFNTLFMTMYPLWGKTWWENPQMREMVKNALEQTKGKFHVHLGLSLFNDQFCLNPSRYPGALYTKQCDGTRPEWVCHFDDSLWDVYIRNCVEMAKLGKEVGNLDGVFLDPEGYPHECYFCFCDNCVRKFNAWRVQGVATGSSALTPAVSQGERGKVEQMPTGLVKPDGWLNARGLMPTYMQWHDVEVRRHAAMLEKAVHAVNSKLQLSSLLWELPIAVGVDDARARYFKSLAIGLGTKEMPAWTMPEHTYYSDGEDLNWIVKQMHEELTKLGAADRVKVLPGIRLLRRDVASLQPRGDVIKSADLPGYWMYELADLMGKKPIEFEGELIEPVGNYVKRLGEMDEKLK